MINKFINWLNSYNRYYLKGSDFIVVVAIVLVALAIVYFVAYQHGWVNSFELFDKIRPHRPIQG